MVLHKPLATHRTVKRRLLIGSPRRVDRLVCPAFFFVSHHALTDFFAPPGNYSLVAEYFFLARSLTARRNQSLKRNGTFAHP